MTLSRATARLGLSRCRRPQLFQFLLYRDRAARGSRADLAAHRVRACSSCSIRISTIQTPCARWWCTYLAFLVIDLGSAHSRLLMERREKMEAGAIARAATVPLPAAHVLVVLKALFTAAIGPLVGWGKLERKSTVTELA